MLEIIEQQSALHQAVSQENLPLIEALLAAKADVNAGQSATPLQMAVYRGNLTIVSKLLAAKADCNAMSTFGRFPLHQAVSAPYENIELVKLLLAAKAEVNDKNPLYAPLFAAIETGKMATVAILLAAKAEINVADEVNRTPLHRLVQANNIEFVKIFLAAKAEVSTQDNASHTPLWWAVKNKQSRIIELLLEAKANPNEAVINTPPQEINERLGFALQSSVPGVVKALLGARAEINKSLPTGLLPLRMAASHPTHGSEYVTLLLKAKAKFSTRDEGGRTALESARQSGENVAVNLLQSKKLEQERLLALLSGLHGRVGSRSVISQVAGSAIFDHRLLKTVHHLTESAFPNAVSFFNKPAAAAGVEQEVSSTLAPTKFEPS